MTLVQGIAHLLQAVYMIAFIYGVVLIFEAAWSLKSSQISDALNGILAALFLVLGPSLIQVLFSIFSLPGGFDLW
jgi:hypothetical protein